MELIRLGVHRPKEIGIREVSWPELPAFYPQVSPCPCHWTMVWSQKGHSSLVHGGVCMPSVGLYRQKQYIIV